MSQLLTKIIGTLFPPSDIPFKTLSIPPIKRQPQSSVSGDNQKTKSQSAVVVSEVNAAAQMSGISETIRVSKNEQKLNSFIENLPIMFYSVDAKPPHSPFYLSPPFESLGYSDEEWLNQGLWTSIIHEDDRADVIAKTNEAIQSGGKLDCEYRLVGKDKKSIWVRAFSSLIQKEDGKIKAWEGISIDISDRKKAEAELVYREGLYRTIARNLPNSGVILFDNNFRITLAEGEQIERSGFSAKLLEGTFINGSLDRLVGEDWRRYFQMALAGGYVSYDREANNRSYHQYVIPVKNSQGQISGGMYVWQDVTELREKSERLRNNENQLKHLFDNTNDLIFVLNTKGNFVSVNRAVERLFQHSSEELLKMEISQLVSEKHKKDVKNFLASLDETTFEVECISAKKTPVYLEVSSFPVYEDGEVKFHQGIARDVTERKNAERRMRKSESELKALFSAITDVVFEIDRNGRFLKVPPTNAPEVYRPSGFLVNKTVFEIFEKAQAQYFLDKITESLEKQCSVTAEYSLRINDTEYWFSANVSPATSDSVVVVSRDVSQARIREQMLTHSEEKYRVLVENASDIIFTVDLEGNFTSINKAGETLIGYKRDEGQIYRFTDILAPEYIERSQKSVFDKLNGKHTDVYETEVICRSGKRVRLQVSSCLILEDGKPAGIQGIGRQIANKE